MTNKKVNSNVKELKDLSLTNGRPKKSTSQTNVDFPANPGNSFLFRYDGPHRDFFQELIKKTNAVYSGTEVKIPSGGDCERYGNLIERMALVSTIANDSNLRSAGLYPITATQSEVLLKDERLPKNQKDNWEDLALLLYDTNGFNPKEARALKESIIQHKIDLGLSKSDLEKRLVIVNAGAEVDSHMPYGVKPIIIPGITQVYTHEILNTPEILDKTGQNYFYGYGLEGGLPLLDQLGRSERRRLSMPSEDNMGGLRVLCREWGELDACGWDLDNTNCNGRIIFAHQGRKLK